MSLDPTRTTGLRIRYEAAIRGRFKALGRAVASLVGEDDAFGLEPDQVATSTMHALAREVTANAARQVWRFLANPDKVAAFDGWLQRWAVTHLLADAGGEPWVAPFVRAAYAKGLENAYVDAAGGKLKGGLPEFFAGTKAEFLRGALANPKTRSAVRLLATRSLEDLKGITATAASQMNKILASGLLHGQNPKKIARDMVAQVDGLTKRRAGLIARTEIINAHAEAQLDAFEALGVEDLGIESEWSTALDDRVCLTCSELEGAIFTIDEARGLIPRHPGCRCAWRPATVVAKRDGLRKLLKATAASLKAETGSKTGPASRWAGKVLASKLRRKLARRTKGRKK